MGDYSYGVSQDRPSRGTVPMALQLSRLFSEAMLRHRVEPENGPLLIVWDPFPGQFLRRPTPLKILDIEKCLHCTLLPAGR